MKACLLWGDNWLDGTAKQKFPELHSFNKNDQISVSKACSSEHLSHLFNLPFSEVAFQQFQNIELLLSDIQLVGFINPGSPMDPLPYKTRLSRRRNDSTRLDRPRYTITGQDHDPIPDRHLQPRPPLTGHDPSQVRAIRS